VAFPNHVCVRPGRRAFIVTAVLSAGALAAATVSPGTSDNVRLAAAKTNAAMITPFPGFLLSGGRFTTIDVPGGARTQVVAAGIDDSGTIVGDFDGADGTHHGFVRDSGGKFRAVDFPGARGSTVSAINNKGQLVGRYSLVSPYPGDPAGNSQQHSFVLDNGEFAKIDFPRAVETQALGINNFGQVVGTYMNADGTFGSFLWENGQIRDIDIPGIPRTNAAVSDINDSGQIVGAATPGDNALYGFLLSGGVVTKFQPSGVAITFAQGINNNGQIVGTTYADGTQRTARGFVLAQGATGPFTTITHPNALQNVTVAFGLNNQGAIVGAYARAATTERRGLNDPMPRR
jgi:probable HAF family extracellular repeat protein